MQPAGVSKSLTRSVESGLVEAIDESVDVLKVHLPYHESDHVLNIAYNIMSGGTCLEDIELLRNDEVYLDALGAQRIPDPTTGGDFCRRFDEEDINALMEAFNGVRRRIWSCQPEEFFDEAKIDADGTLLETLGECKEGMWRAHREGATQSRRPHVLAVLCAVSTALVCGHDPNVPTLNGPFFAPHPPGTAAQRRSSALF